jgi:hypothetical protein
MANANAHFPYPGDDDETTMAGEIDSPSAQEAEITCPPTVGDM